MACLGSPMRTNLVSRGPGRALPLDGVGVLELVDGHATDHRWRMRVRLAPVLVLEDVRQLGEQVVVAEDRRLRLANSTRTSFMKSRLAATGGDASSGSSGARGLSRASRASALLVAWSAPVPARTAERGRGRRRRRSSARSGPRRGWRAGPSSGDAEAAQDEVELVDRRDVAVSKSASVRTRCATSAFVPRQALTSSSSSAPGVALERLTVAFGCALTRSRSSWLASRRRCARRGLIERTTLVGDVAGDQGREGPRLAVALASTSCRSSAAAEVPLSAPVMTVAPWRGGYSGPQTRGAQ